MQNERRVRPFRLYLNQKTLLIATIATLSIILYMGNVFAYNTSKLVDLFCLVTFPFLSPSGLLATVAFLTPLNSGITTMYIFGLAVVFLVLRSKKLPFKMLITVLVIATHELFLNGIAGKVNLMTFITYALVVFLFLYGMMNKENINYQAVCVAFVVGTALLLFAVFTTTIQHYPLEHLLQGYVRIGVYGNKEALGGSVAILSDNANNLGYFSAVSVTMGLLLLTRAKGVERLLLLVTLFVNVVIGAFTVSRTWIALVALGVVLVALFRYKGKARFAMLFVVGILFVGFGAVIATQTNIFDAFFERMNELGEDNRMRIFKRYMSAMANRPLRILSGAGALTYKTVFNISGSMHNGLQQIFVAYGVPGFLLWMWMMFSPIVLHFKKRKFRIYRILPLLIAFLFTQTIQFVNPFILMLPYMVAMCYMKIPEECE